MMSEGNFEFDQCSLQCVGVIFVKNCIGRRSHLSYADIRRATSFCVTSLSLKPCKEKVSK